MTKIIVNKTTHWHGVRINKSDWPIYVGCQDEVPLIVEKQTVFRHAILQA